MEGGAEELSVAGNAGGGIEPSTLAGAELAVVSVVSDSVPDSELLHAKRNAVAEKRINAESFFMKIDFFGGCKDKGKY